MRKLAQARKFRHMQQKPTITTGEVATLYGVSRRTIGRKIATGDLTPLMKLPGKTGAHVFDASQVQRVFEPSASRWRGLNRAG